MNMWKSILNVATQSISSIKIMNTAFFMTKQNYAKSVLCSMHESNLRRAERPEKKKKNILDGKPYAKGVILKTLIKKPRKPNSANRKCVLVKLSTGKEMVAFVPGIGHNLQEHQTVLCRIGKLKDTPGVKIKCVRGKYDLPHVAKK